MQEIRDCNQRLACMGEADSGIIEFAEKHQKFRAVLPITGSFTVERKGTITTITRVSQDSFNIKSEPLKE